VLKRERESSRILDCDFIAQNLVIKLSSYQISDNIYDIFYLLLWKFDNNYQDSIRWTKFVVTLLKFDCLN